MARLRVTMVVALATLGAAGCRKDDAVGRKEERRRTASAVAASPRPPDARAFANAAAQGRAALARGDYAAAARAFRRAVTAAAGDAALLGDALHQLGIVQRKQGLYRLATASLKRALRLREQRWGKAAPRVGHTLSSLGAVYARRRRFRQALVFHRKAVAILGRAPAQAAVVPALVNLAGTLHSSRRYAEAERTYRRALALARRTLGPSHADVGKILHGLGVVSDLRGHRRDAERWLREALAAKERAHGKSHPLLATTLNSLAIVLEGRKAFAAAEKLYRRALAVARPRLGEEHPFVARIWSNLAASLADRGRHREAGPVCRRAVRAAERALRRGHPARRRTFSACARVLRALGKPREARALALRARAEGRRR